MMKNSLIAALVVMNIGWAIIVFDQVALADKKPVYERQGWTRIEGPGSCYIYYKHARNLGKTIYASTCTSLAVTG